VLPSPDALIAAMRAHGTRPALRQGTRQLGHDEVVAETAQRADRLLAAGSRRVAIALDNGVDWALWDLAALQAGLVCAPLPSFFSPAQQAHVLERAGIDTLVADHSAPWRELGFGSAQRQLARREIAGPAPLPAGTVKVTFTSGTTAQPKGVCLGADSLLAVADSLRQATAPCAIESHLCVLPLATLLENVGGIYAPLLTGARVDLAPMAEIGLTGASGLDVGRFLAALDRHRPNSLILVPQMLQALVGAAESGAALPPSLRFVAVGGAQVSPTLLQRAERLGLAVYEGYGLSECASVVCLNTPAARRAGSVGRPLPHAEVRIGSSGEVLLRGPHMLGYLGEAALRDEWLDSGDLGRIEDGFLYLQGRRKHQFITAYGRNVNPEWVEAELAQQPGIAQAWLYGEALPANVAVLVARTADTPRAALQEAVDAVNRTLPDYARVHRWLLADAPFGAANGLATANGRLRRDALLARYRDRILLPTPPEVLLEDTP
jgi:long-subunit acyl-CoA synthetase (AMP-forming)